MLILVNTCQETKSDQFQLASQCYTDKFYKEAMTRCTNSNLMIQQNFAFTCIFQLLYHLSCASSMNAVLWSPSRINIIRAFTGAILVYELSKNAFLHRIRSYWYNKRSNIQNASFTYGGWYIAKRSSTSISSISISSTMARTIIWIHVVVVPVLS
jgi:hypothetical protein